MREAAAAELVGAPARRWPARPSCGRGGGCRGGPRRGPRGGPRARRATGSVPTPAYLKPTVWSSVGVDGDADLDALAGDDRLEPAGRGDRRARPRRGRARRAGSAGRRCETAPLATQGLSAPPTRIAGDRELEPGLRLVLEAGGVQPDPALGVLDAPVVADGRAPADDVDERAVEHDAPAGDPVRHRRLELRARDRQAVERGGPQVAQRRPAAGQRRAPTRAIRPRARASPRNACAEAPPGRQLGQRLLDRRRRAGGGIEDRAPERGGASRRPRPRDGVVCRIQSARGERPGSASRALRNQDSYRPATEPLCRPTHPVP